MKIRKPWVSLEEIQAGKWASGYHTHIKGDITDTPWIWTDVSKTGSNLTDLATRQHAGLTNITENQHHAKLHGASHHSGGGDAIKLDDLASPDDNTDLNALTTKHGLLKKLGGGIINFLRADGAWADPAAGNGATTFVGLTDTPANYIGEGGKYCKVKVGEDGLEFAAVNGNGGGIGWTKAVYENFESYEIGTSIHNKSVLANFANWNLTGTGTATVQQDPRDAGKKALRFGPAEADAWSYLSLFENMSEHNLGFLPGFLVRFDFMVEDVSAGEIHWQFRRTGENEVFRVYNRRASSAFCWYYAGGSYSVMWSTTDNTWYNVMLYYPGGKDFYCWIWRDGAMETLDQWYKYMGSYKYGIRELQIQWACSDPAKYLWMDNLQIFMVAPLCGAADIS